MGFDDHMTRASANLMQVCGRSVVYRAPGGNETPCMAVLEPVSPGVQYEGELPQELQITRSKVHILASALTPAKDGRFDFGNGDEWLVHDVPPAAQAGVWVVDVLAARQHGIGVRRIGQ